MDWPALIQSLSDSAPSTELVNASSAELVIGNTTFLLEHESDPGVLHARATLGPLPPSELLKPELLLRILQDNMELHAAGLGSIAVDPLDSDLVWQKTWPLHSLHENAFHETLLGVAELGTRWSLKPGSDAPARTLHDAGGIDTFLQSLEDL